MIITQICRIGQILWLICESNAVKTNKISIIQEENVFMT